MDRRTFIRVATTSVIATPLASCATRPGNGPVHHMDRERPPKVWFNRGVEYFPITGWHVEVQQDIDWNLFGWGGGRTGAKFGVAHPWQGDWEKIDEMYVGPAETHKLIKRWRPDNEDLFLWAYVEDSSVAGNFRIIDATVGNSNAAISDDYRVYHMSWNQPQEIHLQLEPA
jgi:hypothetical protein